MVHVQRTFSVTPDPATVVDYLADFSRAEQWDPGTKTCTTTSTGPVGVGSTWHNHGLAKLADPFMHNEFEKLGDETVESMTTTLNAL